MLENQILTENLTCKLNDEKTFSFSFKKKFKFYVEVGFKDQNIRSVVNSEQQKPLERNTS